MSELSRIVGRWLARGEETPQHSPGDALLWRLVKAVDCAARGDTSGASACCDDLYATQSKHPDALRELAQRGILDEAADYLDELSRLALDPQTAYRLLNELGYCHSLAGRIERAAACYGDAFARRPNMSLDAKDYHRTYNRALATTQSTESDRRRPRYHLLVVQLARVLGLEGDIAECGCWRGLSSTLMCTRLREHDAGFAGAGYHIFDSFQGLSRPGSEDRVNPALEGKFAVEMQTVRANLAEFPAIAFHPGWIPASFAGVPERRYRFVHLDVDLFEPTQGALAYFLPRMVPGSILVCDDYGWPGARKALDEAAAAMGLAVHVAPGDQAWLELPA